MLKIKELNDNGDFRSEECIAYLKEADVVVTNPPFSLFREYIKQLMDYKKKFIILANNNAITYKEFFPYIKNGEVWLGRTLFTGKMPFFRVPDNYPLANERFEKRADGLYKQVNAITWYTNVPNDSNREVLDMYKKYNPTDYPTYDNYNAIECGRMEYLPYDYEGVIGIPITGLKYLWSDGTIHTEHNGNPKQFEIVGCADADITPNGWKGMSADFVEKYYAQGNTGAYKEGNRLACYVNKGKAIVPYKRILIRRIA